MRCLGRSSHAGLLGQLGAEVRIVEEIDELEQEEGVAEQAGQHTRHRHNEPPQTGENAAMVVWLCETSSF